MDFFTTEFLWALLAIVFIDLVLAGDNAIVIGMAARKLPKEQQKTAIFWGTAGAIVIRAISTVIVVWLLKIPALMIGGGLLLLWIAYNLVATKKEHNIKAQTSLRAAVQTIVIADGVMGIDNVMGVAGVAHGNMVLVIIGLLITVPIIIWGSTMFIQLVEHYPSILYIGGAILAWTAGGMITGDPLVRGFATPTIEWLVNIAAVVGIMGAAWMTKRRTA